MKHLPAVVIAMVLAASAYGAVGDLTAKSCDPGRGGFMASMTGPGDVRPAPADCGTVNPNAKLITLHGVGLAGPDNARTIVVALDSAKADDKVLDVLRFDASGTGKFTAEASIPLKWHRLAGKGAFIIGGADGRTLVGSTDSGEQAAQPQGESASIEPQTFKVTRYGRQVPVMVRGNLTTMASAPAAVFLQIGSCLEGTCAFGDQVRAVRIIDTTGNQKMTDPTTVTLKNGAPAGIVTGDALMIETDARDGNPLFSSPAEADGKRFGAPGFYGQPAFVDGKWYDVTISADGAKVTAAPTKGPFGRIKLGADQWLALLVSAEHVLAIEAGKDAVEVPAGKYAVIQSQMVKNKSVAIVGDYAGMAQGKAMTLFEVAADKSIENPFGLPFTTRVEAAVAGRTVTLTPTIRDSGGRSVGRLAATDPEAKAGQFEVCDAAGKVVYSAALEYT